jgi:hypothetical protein
MVGAGFGVCGAALQTPAMEEPESADDYGCFEGEADEGVGPSAVVLEGGDGAFEEPEDVEVGDLGGEGHGGGGVGGLAVEAGAGEDGSGHEVGQGVHWVQHIVWD